MSCSGKEIEQSSSSSSSSEEGIHAKEAVLNFSIDSGMEDPVLPQSQSASDDSDDEIVCKRKAILEDDNSDDDCVITGGNEGTQGRSPSPSNENKENVPAVGDGKDNSDDDEDDDLKLNLEMENDNDEIPEEKDDGDDNEISEGGSVEPTSVRMEFKDSDIFDAESDDEQRPALTDDEENNSAQGNDGDEGFDESQIDPALLAKLKKMKGASKTPKQKEKLNRKAKPTAEQMTELYSESQRMLRDSRVNLPYYEPEAKSLDDFLARASKKRQEYSALSKPKDFQKALIIHEKLSVTPPKQSPSQKAKNSKLSLKSRETKDAMQELPSVSIATSHDSGVESQELVTLSRSNTVILTESIPTSDSPHCIENDNAEELPDINPIPPQVDPPTTSSGHMQIPQCSNRTEESTHSPSKSNSQEAQVLSKEDEECNKKVTEVIRLQKDPSRDLFNSMTTEEQIEEESFQKIIQDVEGDELCIEIDNEGKDCENTQQCVDGHISSSSISFEKENHEASERQDRIEEEFLKRDENTCDEGLEDTEILEAKSLNCQDEKLGENNDTPNSKSYKLRLLEKLEQQGLVVPDLPKLSGSPDSVINLDHGAPAKTPKDSGVLKLMDRLIQHQTKKKPHASYDVNLSIIEKEGTEGGQKELKLKSLTYHVEKEKEELPSTAPGAKLVLLKEKLGAGMKIKREEARLRRQQMFNLENEEGFEGGSKSDEEQEEAEMTDDESSSDGEEEEGGLMGMMDGSDDGEDYNPFLDAEARDDDDEEEDIFGMDENSNDVKLRFEVSEDEDGSDEEEKDGDDKDEEDDAIQQILNGDDESTPVKRKKKSHHRILSDDEDSKPGKEISNQESDVESLPEIELTPLTKHFQDTQRYLRDSSRSPELYGPSQFEESSNSTRPGDNLNDSGSNYNPHSQMLDADGYLKMTPTQRPPKSRISLLVDAPEPEDNAIMDGFDSSCKMSAGKIFGGMSGRIDSQVDNMSELLGLCSGNFQQNSLSEDAINPSQNITRYEDDESEHSNPFRIVNDDEDDSEKVVIRKRIKPVLSDSEDEREADTDIEDEDDGPGKFSGFKDKLTKGIRREFLEDEAELSGSEYDSDENVDLAEEDDILEEEAGDRDMAGVSEEELRNQVGKVHMKQLLDDDDRAVMRFKEMYLQDGDLHSDGNGRMRNFRWKDAGDSSQQDMFEHHSDEEQVEEDVEEIKWRKERIEREKFLEESQQGEGEPNQELQKFGQLFVKRSDSTSSLNKTPVIQQKPSNSKPSLKKKGSFLSRGKAALVQFAHVAKTALGGNTKQNARSFVFQSKENQEQENAEKEEIMPQPMQPPKRKAHSGVNTPQVAKKPRLSSNSKQQAPPPVKRGGSIFNLLDN